MPEVVIRTLGDGFDEIKGHIIGLSPEGRRFKSVDAAIRYAKIVGTPGSTWIAEYASINELNPKGVKCDLCKSNLERLIGRNA